MMCFRSASLQGSSQQDSPSLAGWGNAVIPRQLGVTMDLSDIQGYCESPIERLLANAVAEIFSDYESAGLVLSALAPCEYTASFRSDASASAYLIPQATVGGCDQDSDWTYRVDFLLVCGSSPAFRRCFAIECDGHEWHEKTKDQVARDKRRDRRMIMDGITPIRFSGSEIHKDASGCADYLRSLAHSALGDVLREEFEWSELRGQRGRQ